MNDSLHVRLDKWLWATRLFKTRALAAEEAGHGRIQINGQDAKASREVRIGDRIALRQPGGGMRVVDVRGLSAMRGPAPVAQTLYEETVESLETRRLAAERRRMGVEPALAQTQGRPTKRDRRQLGEAADWQRWSASIDDE